MRVRVRFGDAAVRGPACVRDAKPPGQGLGRELGLEVRDLADGAAQAELAVALHDGKPGRVVAAVLEPPQTLYEDGDDVPLCNGADDTAHTFESLLHAGSRTSHFGFFCGRFQP